MLDENILPIKPQNAVLSQSSILNRLFRHFLSNISGKENRLNDGFWHQTMFLCSMIVLILSLFISSMMMMAPQQFSLQYLAQNIQRASQKQDIDFLSKQSPRNSKVQPKTTMNNHKLYQLIPQQPQGISSHMQTQSQQKTKKHLSSKPQIPQSHSFPPPKNNFRDPKM